MSLTGTTLLMVLILATILAFAAVVIVLPRVAGWRPFAVLARIGSLAFVNVLVLASVGVAVNDKYGFYANWGDLRYAIFGGNLQSSAASYGAPAASTSPSATTPTALPAPTPLQSAAGVPTGRAVSFTVTGALSGLTAPVLVSLPAGYHNSANATHRYPVLETFHGYPSGPSSWYTNTPLTGLLHDLAARHAIAPVITVSPTMQFPYGVDNGCVNGARPNPQVETWLTRDVPAWLGHHFRVDPRTSAWATIGYSAGGWCAAMATMLHPQQYGAGIVLGGYFTPRFFSSYRAFPSTSPLAHRYDLPALAGHKPPPIALWVETSPADHLSYDSTRAFFHATRAPLSVHALTLQHAGHRLAVWNAVLPDALNWLGRTMPGFHAP